MDIEEIKTLTDLMVENDLSEIMLRDGEKRILLRRGGQPVVQAVSQVAPVSAVPAPVAVAPIPAAAPAAEPAVEDTGLSKVTSPMVGTFYRSPDPESPEFVKVGDTVTPDTVVCIIEAMKVFNEIKAEVAGTIESINVEGGSPVEFGQPLMTVRVS